MKAKTTANETSANSKTHILFFLLLILLITFTSAIARATDVKLAKAKIPLIANPQQTNSQAPATRARKSNLKSQVAKTHIPFIANQGQVDERVRYYAQTFGGTVFVTDKGEIVYLMPKSGTENAIVLKEELLDRAHAAVEGEAKTRARVSYLKGKDPSRWKKNRKNGVRSWRAVAETPLHRRSITLQISPC